MIVKRIILLRGTFTETEFREWVCDVEDPERVWVREINAEIGCVMLTEDDWPDITIHIAPGTVSASLFITPEQYTIHIVGNARGLGWTA